MKGLQGSWIAFSGVGIEGVGQVVEIFDDFIKICKAMRVIFNPMSGQVRVAPALLGVSRIKDPVYLPKSGIVFMEINDSLDVSRCEDQWNTLLATSAGLVTAKKVPGDEGGALRLIEDVRKRKE